MARRIAAPAGLLDAPRELWLNYPSDGHALRIHAKLGAAIARLGKGQRQREENGGHEVFRLPGRDVATPAPRQYEGNGRHGPQDISVGHPKEFYPLPGPAGFPPKKLGAAGDRLLLRGQMARRLGFPAAQRCPPSHLWGLWYGVVRLSRRPFGQRRRMVPRLESNQQPPD